MLKRAKTIMKVLLFNTVNKNFKNSVSGDKRNTLKRKNNDKKQSSINLLFNRGVIKMILQTLNSWMHLKGKVEYEKSNMRKAK